MCVYSHISINIFIVGMSSISIAKNICRHLFLNSTLRVLGFHKSPSFNNIEGNVVYPVVNISVTPVSKCRYSASSLQSFQSFKHKYLNLFYFGLLDPCLKFKFEIFLQQTRNCCTEMSPINQQMSTEIKIQVPYGHIAGKIWNEGAPIAVLGLHGWQDNAATFDLLAPLLPPHLCLVAIDFPGHGQSSHKPLGFSTIFMDYVISVDRVVKHFGWKEVIIMGHSLGAAVGMLYAGIRPSLVHSLIMIDLIKPLHTRPEDLPAVTEGALDAIMHTEQKLLNETRPSYTFEQLLKRAMKSHAGSLNEVGVRALLTRGSRQLANGRYCFTYDLQIRTPGLMSMTLEQQLAYASRLTCRMLLMKADEGPFYESKEHYDTIIEKYRTCCREFLYLTVPGTHHTHLDTPHHVFPHITAFLSQDKLTGVQNNTKKLGEEEQQCNEMIARGSKQH